MIAATDMTLAERRSLELAYDGPVPAQALSDLRRRGPEIPASPTPQMVRALRAAAASLRESCVRDLAAITSLLDKRDRSTDDADRAWYAEEAEARARRYESKAEQADDYEAEAAEMEAATP